MKYPPRDAYRIRPPFAVIPSASRHLLASGLFLAGLVIAVLGAFHDVQSVARKPVAHAAAASPPPAGGSFQVLVDPKPALAEPSLILAEPAPTAEPRLRQSEVVATPLAPLYAANRGNPSPVQVWSPSSVLTPVVMAVVGDAVAVPQAEQASVSTAISPPMSSEPAAKQASFSTPQPVPTPISQPVSQPMPSPSPTAAPTPQPSATPTSQPSPTGSPGCVATRRHPCPPRGEMR